MQISTELESSKKLSALQKFALIAAVFILVFIIFWMYPTHSVDWKDTFYPVSHVPLNPYSIKTFINPPWTALILYPLHFFSENISQAINASLNFVIIGLLVLSRKGRLPSLILTLTSFPLLSLIAVGGIEWIPAMGFFLQSGLGIFLLLAKPQSGILAGIDWFFRSKNKSVFILLPLVLIISSFMVWGSWGNQMLANINYVNQLSFGLSDWNISLFPWTIPIGLGFVFYIIKNKTSHSELFGVIATYCLFPYLAPHSLTILFALLSASYLRFSIVIWVLLWLYSIFHT